jgi:hypothetical protein
MLFGSNLRPDRGGITISIGPHVCAFAHQAPRARELAQTQVDGVDGNPRIVVDNRALRKRGSAGNGIKPATGPRVDYRPP